MSEAGHGYEARLFHPDWGNEAVEGIVRVNRWKVYFEAKGLIQEIPAERLSAEWVESEGRICLRDAEIPELSLFLVDEGILARPPLPQLESLRTQLIESRQRRELKRRVRISVYFLAVVVLIGALISLGTGYMVRALASRVPIEWEQPFGEAVLMKIAATQPQDPYSNQVAELTALATPLVQVLPKERQQMKFFIIEDAEPNAAALPGGIVVVNTGLLKLAERPEEIQGVLAHELAHVTEKHLVRELIAASGPLVVFGLFLRSDDGWLNLLSTGTGLAVFQGFSKEQEIEADDVGWRYLLAAQIDPRGMTSLFRKLEMTETAQPIQPRLPQAFSSHPLLKKRISRLEAKWRKLQQKEGFLVQTNSVPRLEPG